MQIEKIKTKIYEIRGQKIMLDFDLAKLYEIETRALKQAVRRNIERFPDDFMFELTVDEVNIMVSQNVIPSKSYLGGAIPYAFAETGVAMLSSVLRSDKAINVNISIMRAFVAIRKYILHAAPSSISRELEEIKDRLKALEEAGDENEEKFDDIYVALTQLAMKQKKEDKPRTPIGFIKK
jgi:hypothetical protein